LVYGEKLLYEDAPIRALTRSRDAATIPALGMKDAEGETGNKGGLGLERTGFRAHCARCRQESLFIHVRISNTRHLVLTLATAGAWSVVWGAALIGRCMRPWRCGVCGWHKPEFRKTGETRIP
jgi:hypothetical protein